MKFSFENLGYIDKGEIIPGRLTLICGDNNTGKTYINYCIYGLLYNFIRNPKLNIDENEIVTGCKNVPTIWYNDLEGKKHRHYVDIFIPFQNKCIEVKSTWTAEKNKDCIFLKQNAAKELGYEYEIWVYDAKGEKIECYK